MPYKNEFFSCHHNFIDILQKYQVHQYLVLFLFYSIVFVFFEQFLKHRNDNLFYLFF